MDFWMMTWHKNAKVTYLQATPNMWDRYDNCFEQKSTYRDKNNFPKNINNLYDYLTSSQFID